MAPQTGIVLQRPGAARYSRFELFQSVPAFALGQVSSTRACGASGVRLRVACSNNDFGMQGPVV